MKRLIFAAALAFPIQASAQTTMSTYPPPPLPDGVSTDFNIPASLMLIAGAAQQCQLRPPAWSAKLIEIAWMATEQTERQELAVNGVVPVATKIMVTDFMSQNLVAGETFSPGACEALPNLSRATMLCIVTRPIQQLVGLLSRK